jgi:IPT/TIG domain
MSRKTAIPAVIVAALTLVLGLAFYGCGKAATKPEIKSLDPTSGGTGSEVVISGGSFGTTQGTGVVFFGQEEADIVAWSDTSITANVPSDLAAAKYGVTVETTEGASNAVDFTVEEALPNAPKITSLDPVSGGAGVEVVISGSKFGATQGSGKILFGPGTAEVVKWSDTSITFKVPADATPNTYGVKVENAEGKSNQAIYTLEGGGEDLSGQKQAVIAYMQEQGQSTAGSDKWTISLVKQSATDPNWEVVSIHIPDVEGGQTIEALVILNNMLGGWQCLSMEGPPWTGVEFKGEPVPADLENV